MNIRNISINLILKYSIYIIIFIFPVLSYLLFFNQEIKSFDELKGKIDEYNKKIEKFNVEWRNFERPDGLEQSYWDQMNREFDKKVPMINTREDLILFNSSVIKEIREIAKRNAMADVSINSEITDMSINVPQTISSQGNVEELKGLKEKNVKEIDMRYEVMESFLLKLSYSGDFKNCINFINEATHVNYLVSIIKIDVKRQVGEVLYIVYLKVYYKKGDNVKE
ncbi:MAG: hypothetical protein AB1410_09410 [Acidobacteriota bacterium]